MTSCWSHFFSLSAWGYGDPNPAFYLVSTIRMSRLESFYLQGESDWANFKRDHFACILKLFLIIISFLQKKKKRNTRKKERSWGFLKPRFKNMSITKQYILNDSNNAFKQIPDVFFLPSINQIVMFEKNTSYYDISMQGWLNSSRN